MQGHRFRRFQPLEKLPEPTVVPELSCGNTTPSRSGGGVAGRLSGLVQSLGNFIHGNGKRRARGRRRCGLKFLKLKQLSEGAKKRVWGLKGLRPRLRLSWRLSPIALLRRLKESYVPMMITFASGKGKLVELDTVSCQYCCRRGFQPEVLCKHCKETSRNAHVTTSSQSLQTGSRRQSGRSAQDVAGS